MLTRKAISDLWSAFKMPVMAPATDNAAILAFHERALEIIGEEQGGMVKAMNAVDTALKSEVRLARQAGIWKMTVAALNARLTDAAAPLLRVIDQAKALIDEAMNREPKDPAFASSYWLRVADVRAQLAQLSDTDRIQAVLDMAKAAHPTLPEILLNSLKPVVPETVSTAAVVAYQQAYAGDRAPLLDQAREARETMDAILGNAAVILGVGNGGAGLPVRWIDLDKFPVAEIVRAWPQPTRVKFVQAFGQDAYTALLNGKWDLSQALSLFRPGLVR